MTVRYRELALSDLEQISQYLKPRSPAGAQTVLQAIYNAIEQIERHPYSAIETSVSGIRVLIIGRYRYKIFYALLRMTPSKSFIFDTRRVGLGRASRVDAARQIETAMRRRFDHAIVLIEIDGVLPGSVLARVRALPQVQQARPLRF